MNVELNDALLPKLKKWQALTGGTDLKDTINLLVSLGGLVVDKSVEGGIFAFVNEEKQTWTQIAHPALVNLLRIRAENEK